MWRRPYESYDQSGVVFRCSVGRSFFFIENGRRHRRELLNMMVVIVVRAKDVIRSGKVDVGRL